MVLLDDSNSYWWLVNVLKADEVGYIPAENIETPNDRLARLNKMRNVEVCQALSATPTEISDLIRRSSTDRCIDDRGKESRQAQAAQHSKRSRPWRPAAFDHLISRGGPQSPGRQIRRADLRRAFWQRRGLVKRGGD